MKVFFTTLLILSLSYLSAFSQDKPDPANPQGENLEVPEEWKVRLDHEDSETDIGSDPDSSDIYFVNMTPGWHITTGPAGIFYHPANTAEGNYTLQTTIHLFDPGERNREAFGLFFGGENLEDDNQEYLYFLIRNTGEFLIKSRTGDETGLIQDWTASDVINIYDDPEVSSVENELSLTVTDQTITFLINGEEVAEINSDELKTDGIFGLRVNHSINLHISNINISD